MCLKFISYINNWLTDQSLDSKKRLKDYKSSRVYNLGSVVLSATRLHCYTIRQGDTSAIKCDFFSQYFIERYDVSSTLEQIQHPIGWPDGNVALCLGTEPQN